LGEPFGKELTLFDLESLYSQGKGAIQAKFTKSFGEYKMPMGVEAMSEEIIVCNMNNGTVEFTDFEGNINLTLPTQGSRGPKTFKEPSVATILLGNTLLLNYLLMEFGVKIKNQIRGFKIIRKILFQFIIFN
jgi:hypothetical protein